MRFVCTKIAHYSLIKTCMWVNEEKPHVDQSSINSLPHRTFDSPRRGPLYGRSISQYSASGPISLSGLKGLAIPVKSNHVLKQNFAAMLNLKAESCQLLGPDLICCFLLLSILNHHSMNLFRRHFCEWLGYIVIFVKILVVRPLVKTPNHIE